MNTISIYYPNKKIHVIKYGDGGDDEITYLLIAIANNKKSYLIDMKKSNQENMWYVR